MKPIADAISLSPDLDELPMDVIASHDAVPSRAADFYELTKPRMNFLVVLTTMIGFCMATRGPINWLLLFHTILGTTLTAASAAIFNQLIEREHDAKMPRTKNRPIPTGRISMTEASACGFAVGIAGVLYLAFAVNILTAALGLATLLIYLFIYTPLKRVSSLNTVIGAIPGAIPPVMGFTAVQHTISLPALSLFGILFLWQMPHFLAIAILYKRDYQLGGFKMLPAIEENQRLTSRMILLYAAALLPVSLLPTLLGMTGTMYFTAAAVLGLAFFACGVACAVTKTRTDARQLFFASIIYLPLLLGAMMFDKVR